MALDTPIIFILFRRPETTRRVFEEIRRAKPRRLFLVADGPRGPQDDAACRLAREVVADIDWECETSRYYAEKNLGVATRVSSGITKAFEHVEEAIILEDDTLPSPFFFQYCESLLEYWRRDEKVFHISGINFLHGKSASGDSSYYFHRHPAIWGWATWKRAWSHYDLRLPDWPWHQKNGLLQRNLRTQTAIKQWDQIFDLHYDNDDPWTWDYHWTYATWVKSGLAASPRQNLVTNLGFGKDATHTGNAEAPDLPIDPKHTETIIHPLESAVHEEFNLLMERHIYGKPPNKLRRGLSKLWKLVYK